MRTKRAIKLEGSDEIFEHLDGGVEDNVLEKILENATTRKIDKNQLIIVTHHERVSNFNHDNPKYKDVIYRVPLKELFKIYKNMWGESHKQPSFEEKEQKLRSL